MRKKLMSAVAILFCVAFVALTAQALQPQTTQLAPADPATLGPDMSVAPPADAFILDWGDDDDMDPCGGPYDNICGPCRYCPNGGFPIGRTCICQ